MWRNSLFGHVRRLPEDTPAHVALKLQFYLTKLSSQGLNCFPFSCYTGVTLCHSPTLSPVDEFQYRHKVEAEPGGLDILDEELTVDLSEIDLDTGRTKYDYSSTNKEPSSWYFQAKTSYILTVWILAILNTPVTFIRNQQESGRTSRNEEQNSCHIVGREFQNDQASLENRSNT